jgi:hypothetical protein
MSTYFAELERELTTAAGQASPRRRPGRRVVLLAAAALVAAGVPAAAVTGVFKRDRGRDEVSRLFHVPPIGEGVTPRGARWQLLAYQDGKRFCFGIAHPSNDPRAGQPGGGGGCDDHPPGVLTVYASSSSPGRYSPPGPRHSLASGTAPDAAVTVELSVGSGRISVRTFDDPKGIKGRFYVAEIPFRWQRQRRHARAFDARGRVIARAGG